MNQVAKLLIIDREGKYLLLCRNAHPAFDDDPDLPGGTVERGEEPLEAMVREAYEELGVEVDANKASLVYEGTEYSSYNTQYSLYVITLENRPPVTLSWEHAAYDWITRDDFLRKAKGANDTYMHMVYDVLK